MLLLNPILNLSQLNETLSKEDFFLIDQKVYDFYASKLSCLEGKVILCLDNPEYHKSFAGFEKVSSFFLKNKIKRSDRLIAIGGGAISDLAGFVASSLLRGISWGVVPTTLLSMIDASIGGKTGINSTLGKNLIGSFHKPSLWLTSLEFLKTLKSSDYQSGLGELIKYHFISNSLSLENSIEKTIIDCAKLKNEIVEQDFLDVGKREVLNFGHTFGHAIEKMTKLSHGESVLYGISISLSLFSKSLLPVFNSLLIHYKMQLTQLQLNIDETLEMMTRDKKNTSNKITIIVISSIGQYQKLEFSIEDLKKRIQQNENCKNYFN